jgi:nitrite reductase/ring-hydroxylating ferredoxin subunit
VTDGTSRISGNVPSIETNNKTEEVVMEKIGSLKDIKKGESMSFTYKGEKAILIRTKKDELAAYVASAPMKGEP